MDLYASLNEIIKKGPINTGVDRPPILLLVATSRVWRMIDITDAWLGTDVGRFKRDIMFHLIVDMANMYTGEQLIEFAILFPLTGRLKNHYYGYVKSINGDTPECMFFRTYELCTHGVKLSQDNVDGPMHTLPVYIPVITPFANKLLIENQYDPADKNIAMKDEVMAHFAQACLNEGELNPLYMQGLIKEEQHEFSTSFIEIVSQIRPWALTLATSVNLCSEQNIFR